MPMGKIGGVGSLNQDIVVLDADLANQLKPSCSQKNTLRGF